MLKTEDQVMSYVLKKYANNREGEQKVCSPCKTDL